MNPWMRIVIVVGALSAMPVPGRASAACLKYETVTLTGTLVRQTYAGPPDYESVTQGDAPQVIWILQLDSGICVEGPDPTFPREYNEREVQLVLTADQRPQYRNLLGARIIATGKLLPGGAKYDKRLVLEDSAIKRTGVLDR